MESLQKLYSDSVHEPWSQNEAIFDYENRKAAWFNCSLWNIEENQ